ncbi:MAG: MFS transporter SET family sugar efflux transporter [Puniceicoccaceae bacterium 5H]|nr:MAG: MFS transporter SET family sugar efflux transporter [Puniceicoccaceae bacterium 5H]
MLRRLFQTARQLHRQPNFTGLLASTFALGTAFAFAAPFMSKWGTEEVGLTPTQFSLFMTMTSVSAMLVSTALGRLSDTTFSRRNMLIVGSVGGLLGFTGYALVRDPLWLVLIGCSLHALASICFAQLFSHVREVYDRREEASQEGSGFIMSVVRVCFSFSWTVGPALGSAMLLAFGFRGLYLAAAALYGAFLVGVLFFVPHRRRERAPQGQPRQAFAKTLLRPDLLLCFLTFAAVFAANAINMMNLPLAITRSLGGTERDFGIVFGIGPLVEIPLMLWFGHLAAKGFQLPLIKLGVGITLLYFLGLAAASAPWHVYLLQCLNGASFAILTNVAILFFQDLLPRQLGLATSIFSNSQAAGSLVGMFSFGFIVEAVGHQNAFLVCAALTGVALALILCYRTVAERTESAPVCC